MIKDLIFFVSFTFGVIFTTLLFIIFSPVIVFFILPKIKKTWRNLKTQAWPDWCDESLKPLLARKLQEEKKPLVGLINFFYAFFYSRGRQGNYSWHYLEQLIDHIKLPNDFKPDAVIGIKSGGAFIANYLHKKYKISEIDYFKISHYSNKNSFNRFKSVFYARYKNSNQHNELKEIPKISLVGKRILLVDDQLATGQTLKIAKKFLIDAGALEVKTMVLFVHKDSVVDYTYAKGFMYVWPWGIDS